MSSKKVKEVQTECNAKGVLHKLYDKYRVKRDGDSKEVLKLTTLYTALKCIESGVKLEEEKVIYKDEKKKYFLVYCADGLYNIDCKTKKGIKKYKGVALKDTVELFRLYMKI